MADAQRASVLLTPSELQGLRDGGADVAVLAVHSVNPYTGQVSFDGRRIPGAIDTQAYRDFQAATSPQGGQRPLPDILALQEKARLWGLRKESTIVVYDGDRSMTAARAWWVLKWAGFTDVRVLDGAFPAWLASGLPVSKESVATHPSDVSLTPGHMPELDADKALNMARDGVLLDARIKPNYIGGPVEPGAPARGHIPHAISSPAHDNLTDYGTFTDSQTLKEMYGALGVDGIVDVGVYCGAGMSAAHTVLALAAIGITAALYPGSWSAWVSDPDRPVVVGGRPI
jgi:thiosulfate/3-mercaptopyruvate sulfurtransferase